METIKKLAFYAIGNSLKAKACRKYFKKYGTAIIIGSDVNPETAWATLLGTCRVSNRPKYELRGFQFVGFPEKKGSILMSTLRKKTKFSFQRCILIATGESLILDFSLIGYTVEQLHPRGLVSNGTPKIDKRHRLTNAEHRKTKAVLRQAESSQSLNLDF